MSELGGQASEAAVECIMDWQSDRISHEVAGPPNGSQKLAFLFLATARYGNPEGNMINPPGAGGCLEPSAIETKSARTASPGWISGWAWV